MNTFLLTSSIGAQLDTLFKGFDLAVFQIFGQMQSDVLTVLSKILTSFGSELFIAMFAVMGLVLCFFKRTRKVGLAIVFSVIIGTLLTNVIIKPMVGRVRPYNTLQDNAAFWSWYINAGMLSESDFCFPSGHTTGATEIAVALMLCHIKSKRKPAKALFWIFPLIALLTGASRIYLMVHYPSDVIAAFIIGTAAGVSGFVIASLLCRRLTRNDRYMALLERNVKPIGIMAIALAVMVMFLISFSFTLNNGGEDAVRCSYDGDYNCQNEAETGSKYPAIDGKYYCKIHYDEAAAK